MEETQEKETTERTLHNLSGPDRRSRHIDEEQEFSYDLMRERLGVKSRIDLLLQEKEGRRREGGETKKDGEMPRSEESWLFVKDSDRKRPNEDVGFTIVCITNYIIYGNLSLTLEHALFLFFL